DERSRASSHSPDVLSSLPLAQIRDDCRAARDSHPVVSQSRPRLWRLNVPWRTLLGFLVFFEAFAWIAFAAHGGSSARARHRHRRLPPALSVTEPRRMSPERKKPRQLRAPVVDPPHWSV